MKMAKIVQNNHGQTIWYSSTLEYFGRIYSFTKIFLDFSRANLFGYSFLIFLSCRIYLDIHLSNVYYNNYIQIFIRPKNWYSSDTGWVRQFPTFLTKSELTCRIGKILPIFICIWNDLTQFFLNWFFSFFFIIYTLSNCFQILTFFLKGVFYQEN